MSRSIAIVLCIIASVLISFGGAAVKRANNITDVIAEIFTEKTTTAQPQVSDADYWDTDDYVPYRDDRHDSFSWNLLKEVLLSEDKNVIISPFSVKLVLALLSEAAAPDTVTYKELSSIFSDIKEPDNKRGFYKKILQSFKKENPFHKLKLETRLFVNEFIEPRQKFASIIKSHYDTEVQRLEFFDATKSANIINNWVKNVTDGHLDKLVTEDTINNAVMLMINALYFEGVWRRPFNESFQGAFFRKPTEQVKVDYMEQTDYFYYFDSTNLDAKILRLPYKGKKFAMMVLLPKTKGGLEELFREIKNSELKTMQWMMDKVEVKVTMPKFKFDFKADMKDTLKLLGIQNIFTNNASLPGLARGAAVNGQLKVSNIIQKAGIVVDEKGTQAYAATEVQLINKIGVSTVEEFNANRPFIFFIEDQNTGDILFAGKLLDPNM